MTDLSSLISDVSLELFEHFRKVITVCREKPLLRNLPPKARGNKLEGKLSGFVKLDWQYNLHEKSSVKLFVNIEWILTMQLFLKVRNYLINSQI